MNMTNNLQKIVEKFRDEHEISCPESIAQNGAVLRNAYKFIEDLVEVVGYWEEPYHILVTGGRDYARLKKYEHLDEKEAETKRMFEIDFFFTVMNDIKGDHNKVILSHGGAKGADYLAGRWGHFRGLEVNEYKADWDRYGKRAGVIRNEYMLEAAAPDIVVAFEGGNGTAHMCEIAEKSGVEVVRTWEMEEWKRFF